MLKKTMILASMAVTAMAFAVPSVASAAWTDATVNVGASANVTFAGNALFTSAIGGVSCTETHSNSTLNPGTTGTVNSFTANTATCKGTGGLAGCTVVSVTSTGTPWTAHSTGTAIEITGVNIDNTFSGAFCPYHELRLAGNVTATPDNAHAATKGTLSNEAGALEAYNGTTGATVSTITASGTLNVTPSGTYGIT